MRVHHYQAPPWFKVPFLENNNFLKRLRDSKQQQLVEFFSIPINTCQSNLHLAHIITKARTLFCCSVATRGAHEISSALAGAAQAITHTVLIAS